MRRIGQPISLEGLKLIVPAAKPPDKVMDALIRDAGRAQGATTGNLIKLTDTSLVAASTRLEVPFQPFYEHAKTRLWTLLSIPSGVKDLALYMDSQDKFWNRQVDWFDTKVKNKFELPLRDKDRPIEPNAVMPLNSDEPEPLSLIPEPERADWVNQSLAERKSLRDKLERERRAAERARLEQERLQAAAEDAARRIHVRTERLQSTAPARPSGTPSRSSPPEYGGVPLSEGPRTLPGTPLVSAPLLPLDGTPPALASLPPSLPESEEAVSLPLPPDQPEPNIQPYLLTPEEPEAPQPRAP